MAKDKEPAPKTRSFRWGRMFVTLIVLVVGGAGLYVASWLNSRRYFLVVGPAEARVAKGRMLPIGHEPFVPNETELRRAYEPFTLPSGINVPRGETTFTDRIELDQALFRLLKDCIGFTLSRDDRTTPALVEKYLRQLRAIPGTSVSQQIELGALERDAAFVTARHRLDEGVAALKDAARMFRESAQGPGGAARDGETRAKQIEAALQRLETKDAARQESRGTMTARTATTATSAATAH
jgi:hypothetical protein